MSKNRVTGRRQGNANKGSANNTIGTFTKADSEANKVLNSSRQIDEFEYSYDIIHPPYEPKELLALIDRNDTLKQNITAIATNIAEFGYGIKYQDEFDYNKADASIQKEADNEWERLRRLYKYLNPLKNISALIHDVAVDMHSIGWGMIEIIRNGAGEVCSAEYCRACNFRLVKNNTRVNIKAWEETEKGYEQIESSVKFRKFVQVVDGRKVYFKEFGDPRKMDLKSGEYNDSVAEENLATEIAYFHIHSPYTDYGIPNWINVAIPASGNVLSEILNYKYFSEGRILPMALTVSGGQLTNSSMEALKNSKGLDNAYKIVVIEASPFEDSEEEKFLQKGADPKVSIDVKPLTDTNNTDALFQNYQKDGKEKIRDSLRLPPIYTGASTDYNRATADTARQIGEEQIFIPERKRICDVFNKTINNELGIKYCEVYLKGPKISDTEQKSTMINALNAAGAVTPNMLNDAASEALGKEYDYWNEELGNMPFELIKAKIQADTYAQQMLTQTNVQGQENSTVQKADGHNNQITRLINLIEAELGSED
jgi:PBSX family phage portal protein